MLHTSADADTTSAAEKHVHCKKAGGLWQVDLRCAERAGNGKASGPGGGIAHSLPCHFKCEPNHVSAQLLPINGHDCS